MDTLDVYAQEWFRLNHEGASLREIGRRYGVSHRSVSRILKKHSLPIKVWHSNEFKDISGQKFGLITAVAPLDKAKKGEYYWECYCECNPNQSLKILGPDLRRGRKTHCGCNNPLKIDLSGKRFGFFTVIRDSGQRKNGHVMWECICDCSEQRAVSYWDLTTGHSQSCGCKNKGENHPRWTGGTQVKLFLRSQLKDWKQDSLALYNLKCVISQAKDNLEVHHLNRSFLEIFYEALDILDLEEHKKTGDYSTEEMKKLVDKVVSLHYEHGLGVVITRDLHNEFHSEFGWNSTLDDFKEFAKEKGVIFNPPLASISKILNCTIRKSLLYHYGTISKSTVNKSKRLILE